MEAQKLAGLRNRENQRRSRARRKDYIQDLEQKLQRYELAGVKATTEVQGAARKVADENISLRALLSLYGADHERIEAFLRTGDASFVGKEYSGPRASEEVAKDTFQSDEAWFRVQNYAAACMRASPGIEKAVYPQTTTDGLERATNDAIPIESDTPPRTVTIPRESTTSETAHHAKSSEPTSRARDNTDTDQSSTPPRTLHVDSIDLTLNREEFLPTSTGQDEMSCLAAAEIIAGMRGQDDSDEVWAELGCNSLKRCMIKNVAVFNMIDQ